MDLREAEKENCIGPPCKTDCQIDLPVLLCQSNQPPLWIGFGCVPIGGTTVRHFTILNSGSSSVEIQQSSFSILNDVKVLIGESELVPVSLLSGQSVAASISWSPQKNYSLRENLHISVEPNITLTLSFHGISGIGSDLRNLKEPICRKTTNSIGEKSLQSSTTNERPRVNVHETLKAWCNSVCSPPQEEGQKRLEYMHDIQSLMRSPEVAPLLLRITEAIKSQRLMLRDDQNIRIHVGLREDFTKLLLSYEPFRLQLVLESITHSENNERYDAKRIIGTKILQSDELKTVYCKPGVIMSKAAELKYRRALDEHLLEKFFTAVVLLDQLRIQEMCGENLNLFITGSEVKSTSDVLISFCKRFLKSEKNIIKHMASLGFSPKFYQTPYDEFDFQISNIDDDFRDGIRLTFLINTLSRQRLGRCLCNPSALRIPAISRLQKVHNVASYLHALQEINIRVPFDEKALVDGDRASTVFLMSLIRLEFEDQLIIDDEQIKAEIYRIAENNQRELSNTPRLYSFCQNFTRSANLIFHWISVIAERRNVEVNIPTNMADGKVLCMLISHYVPNSIPSELLTSDLEEGHQLQRKRFTAIHDICNTIRFPTIIPTMESIRSWNEMMVVCFLGFLFCYLLQYEESKRAPKLRSSELQVLKERRILIPRKDKLNSTVIVKPTLITSSENTQECAIAMLHSKVQLEARSRFIAEQKVAEMKLTYDKSLRVAEEEKKILERQLHAEYSERVRMKNQYETDISDEIIRIAEEKLWKEYQAASMNYAATLIQRNTRRMLGTNHWSTKIEAITLIQSVLRGYAARARVFRLKHAISVLQRRFRINKIIFMRQKNQNLSASKIQTNFKIYSYRKRWKRIIKCLSKLKETIVTWTVRRSFSKLRGSVILIQRWVRRCMILKQKRGIDSFVSRIQHAYRIFVARRRRAEQNAALKIQKAWRSLDMRKTLQESVSLSKRLIFLQQSRSSKIIQSAFRAHLQNRKKLHAADIISRWYLSILPLIRIKKIQRGIRRLQALRRSLKIRRNLPAEVKEMFDRVKIANHNSLRNSHLRLGVQSAEAISVLLKGKMITNILRACQILELSTLYSPKCCQQFIKSAASKVLFTLICSCNRSTPHQELLRCALCVLLNVTNDTRMAAELAYNGNTTELLVDLMQMFRDKSAIFNLSCELLLRLMKNQNQIKVECKTADMQKRLDGIYHILERKHRLDMRVKTINPRQVENHKSPTSFENHSPYTLMQQFMKVLNES